MLAKGLAGVVLRVLRLGHGLTRDQLASRIDLDPSYLARLERGDRKPSAKIVQAWLTVCPVPILTSVALASDLIALTDMESEEEATPRQDWMMAQLIAGQSVDDPAVRSRWAGNAGAALRFPASLRLAAELDPAGTPDPLGGLLWLCIRVGRHHQVEVTNTMPAALADALHIVPPDLALFDRFLDTLWAHLQALPVVEAATVAVSDDLWARLGALWELLPPAAKHALVAAAEAWVRYHQ